ncbi:MAG TPA: glycosyltransferase [Alphaproteobacteria bacterium]|nr:glycosyltransferase [Alphaproteobacteria bacterium]
MTHSDPADAPAEAGASQASPLVTILVCNYNYERYLAAALDSALAQDYRPLEIVVVDDGSTDGSRAVLERYGDKIRPLFKANGGQPSALNAGFRASHGEIVCLLDADDVMLPGKVAQVAAAFASDPDAGWVYHELDYIGPDGRPISLAALPDRANVAALARRRARYGKIARLDLRAHFAAGERLPYGCPAFSGLSFRRRALDAILPMPEDIARASDEFPKLAAAALFPGIHLGEPLALQRVHGANAATFRADARAETAIRYINTAYHLRHRYGHIGRSMDKWFASCFGDLVGAVGPATALQRPEARRYIAEHLDVIGLARQAPRIGLHAAWAWLARREAHWPA